jgi:hypothetical protein
MAVQMVVPAVGGLLPPHTQRGVQAMDGVMWVDGTWENSEWVNSRGTRSFFQWFSGNGSITENYISFQPTPTPPSLEILCVGLETIYVFNIVRNCTQLFPSLCMSGT